MTRRKFIRLGGSAIALAGVPLTARALAASQPPTTFGGLTPNSDFYITSYASTPTVDASQWRLRISGLVKNPLEFSYDDIRRLPAIKETLTLECISNPPDGTAISNAEWVGPKLKPILDRAQVDSRAVYASMRAADGYHTGMPIDELMRDENFLPYLMNGVALPADHGFPLRIFIPGKYGMKQPKWITEIELLDHEVGGYWEARGWSASAWRKVNSGFFSPKSSNSLLSIFSAAPRVHAPVEIAGWALAGPSGIKRVEISSDDGATWRNAQLSTPQSRYEWTVWKYNFAPARSGAYTVRVRATDGAGAEQPRSDAQTGSGRSGQAVQQISVVSAA